MGGECPDPTSPSHGYTVLTNFGGRNLAGARAVAGCDSGYRLAGGRAATCSMDGVWRSEGGPGVAPAQCLPTQQGSRVGHISIKTNY